MAWHLMCHVRGRRVRCHDGLKIKMRIEDWMRGSVRGEPGRTVATGAGITVGEPRQGATKFRKRDRKTAWARYDGMYRWSTLHALRLPAWGR